MKNIHKIDQHIYITNDEEPSNAYSIIRTNDEDGKFTYKKIILTTDKNLIKDGVQAIDDEFLEWFVKNPNCDEVKVLRCPIQDLYLIIHEQEFIRTVREYEQMYSEKEVRNIAEEVRWQAIGNPLEFSKNFDEWFEQFKKK